MPVKGSCANCNSSDANTMYEDGHSFCYSCKNYVHKGNKMEALKVVPITNNSSNTLKSVGIVDAIPERRIAKDTARLYNTAIKKSGSMTTHHIYQYFDKDGTHVANKVREVQGKKFWSEGNLAGAGLFGQHIFGKAGKFITICEGEVDAMSGYELLGSKWPVVSIKNGAASAVQNCTNSFEYLNKFDKIVLCFDNDKAGKEAALLVADLFEPNKCLIMDMEFKDANEYLKTNQREKFSKAWWNARPFTPVGIVNLADLGETLYDEKYCETVPYPWQGLNDKTYGIRTGELVTFTSGAGMGKSSIIRELMHHIMSNTKDNIGVLAMEENIRNTAFNLMSVEANARLYIKEVRDSFTREQLTAWQEKTIGTGRFFAFDHFGSISNDEILGRVRFMARGLKCKWIVLDHLSILVSGQEDNGDERKSIDILMTKLRSLVEETGIGLLLVSHLRRPSGDKGHEDGREVSLSHLRGSASIAHLSDSVIALERNQQATDPAEANTTTIRVLKNRYTGDTGVSCRLHYDKESGRMTELENPFVEEEENNIPF
jgi:twinkle protein